MALEGLKNRILSSVGLLSGKREADEEAIRELTKSLRRALLEADFNVRQAKELTERIERRLLEEQPRPGVRLDTHAMNLIYTELVRLLGPAREIRPHNETVLMVGLYGQGKTTTTAKIAEWWRRHHGVKVAVIEADVHRPGAYEQLCQLLEDSPVESMVSQARPMLSRSFETESQLSELLTWSSSTQQAGTASMKACVRNCHA